MFVIIAKYDPYDTYDSGTTSEVVFSMLEDYYVCQWTDFVATMQDVVTKTGVLL